MMVISSWILSIEKTWDGLQGKKTFSQGLELAGKVWEEWNPKDKLLGYGKQNSFVNENLTRHSLSEYYLIA